jgi:hypothetical protein
MGISLDLEMERVAESIKELLSGELEIVKTDSPDGETTWRVRRYVERND